MIFSLYEFLYMPGWKGGFNKVQWEVADYKSTENPSITFKYHSKDGV